MTTHIYPGQFRVGSLNIANYATGKSDPFEIEPKLLLLFVLCGRQEFMINDQRFVLDAGEGDDARPVAMACVLRVACKLSFLMSQGAPFRKLAIAAPPDWLDHFHGDGRHHPMKGHDMEVLSDHVIWHPHAETVRLATQIVLSPPEPDEQQLGLFRMSRGIEILRRTLNECQPAQTTLLHQAHNRTAEDLRLYILKNLTDDLSIAHLEQIFCRNRRSLQRAFKAEFGVGLAEFIRSERLKQANLALCHDGITIADAAYLAGYSNTANFSTAFRRAFGMPPAQAQKHAI